MNLPVRLVAKPELPDNLRRPLRIKTVDHGHRDAPSLFCRCIAADLQERADASKPCKGIKGCLHDLAAPDRSICSISGSIKRYTDHRIRMIILGHAGQDMRIMVLHLHDRNPLFIRNQCRVVFWMHITRNQRWLCLQKLLHPDNRLLKSLHRAQIRHIADIRRLVK